MIVKLCHFPPHFKVFLQYIYIFFFCLLEIELSILDFCKLLKFDIILTLCEWGCGRVCIKSLRM